MCDGRVQMRVRRGPISKYVRSRRPTAPVVVCGKWHSGQANHCQLAAVRFGQQPRLGILRQVVLAVPSIVQVTGDVLGTLRVEVWGHRSRWESPSGGQTSAVAVPDNRISPNPPIRAEPWPNQPVQRYQRVFNHHHMREFTP